MADPVVLALRAALAQGDSAQIRNALGEHLLRQGDAGGALAEFGAALALEPGNAAAQDGARRAALASAPTVPDVTPVKLRPASPGSATRSDRPPVQAGGGAEDQDDEEEDEDGDEGDERSDRGPLRLVAQDGEALDESESPAVTFADVGGMDEVKERLTRSFLLPLKNPELVRKFGKTSGGGLVLYGPPGCGKTFVARAVAGEIGARFVNVGLNEVLDMWFGESEKRLHELFENARRRAPTVIFFDEADALGQRRSQLKGSAGRTLVNQLLAEMDGFAAKNERVFFLAATNHPWDVDPALRRPGRFDRLVFVPPPDAAARKRILELKLAGRPVAPGVDLAKLAKGTDGFSGADLAALVDGASERALEASVRAGRERPIDEALLSQALRDLRPSTRPWFETARNYALYANEGGTYDDLLVHLRKLGLG